MSRSSYAAVVSSSSSPLQTMANTSQTTSVIDVNHPLFLHSSDNPGTLLVNQLLNDQNYLQWSRAIKLALSAKMKLGMIDGTVTRPISTSPEFAQWNRCNDMVVSWLLNSISIDIRNSVSYFSTAKEIWDDLSVRFSQSNVPRIYQLKKELSSLTQGTMSISSYFTKYRTLSDEIDNLAPLPKCVCSSTTCTCDYSAKLVRYEQINKLSQFVMGLSDQYTGIRGQMLMMKPLPSLSQAYSLLLQEESQRDCTGGGSILPENTAMNVRFAGSKPRSSANPKKYSTDNANSVLVCDFCQMSGHSKDKCFCIYGYPERHKLYGKPKPKPRLAAGSKKTAAHVQSNAEKNVVSSDVSTPDMQGNTGFTATQCDQIAMMIQNSIKAASTPASPANVIPWAGVSSSHIADAREVKSNDKKVSSSDSGPGAYIGDIKGKVGAVGVCCLTSEIPAKASSTEWTSSSNSGNPAVAKLPEDLIFLQILPRLNSNDVLPMTFVSKSWASFILHNGPGLMLFNKPQNPIPNSILFEVHPMPDSVSVCLSPETRHLCKQSKFLIVPMVNSVIKPAIPLFTDHTKFLEQASVVGTCCGIICFRINRPASKFVLVNPLTKLFKDVSGPQISVANFDKASSTGGFFYDEGSKDMKIVECFIWDRASLEEYGPNRIHTLQVYSVQSGKWESISLRSVKLPHYSCAVLPLPKPLIKFVDLTGMEPGEYFWVDFHDKCLKPIPELQGVGVSIDRVCWVYWMDKVGIGDQNGHIYLFDEPLATWKEYVIPDEVNRRNFIYCCLDDDSIIMQSSQNNNIDDYTIFDSKNGAVSHLISLPSCRLFPYIPTLFSV